jgi:hypothetical protein
MWTLRAGRIEDEDDAARRHLGNIFETRGLTFRHLDPVQLGIVGVFEFLIGNADWSVPALHNIRVIRTLDENALPLAYDFDWSGLVSAAYATPDPRLPIRSVQDRLYRGSCLTPQEMAQVLGRFQSKRAEIEALYAEPGELDPAYVRFVRGYIAEFFRIIGTPSLVQQALVSTCRELGG